MTSRMELLEDAFAKVCQYTKVDGQVWRPGLIDLWVYDTIIGMHESDEENGQNATYIWKSTPDEIMQHILNKDMRFDLEYGTEQLDDEIREYLIQEKFIVHVDDEENQTNLENGN